MAMDLSSGAAIVTGAAGGIGASMVHGLAGAGMAVVAADRDAEGLVALRAAVMREVPDAAPVVQTLVGDVRDPAHHGELVAAARELGGVRLSVLNAGVTVTGWSWELPLAEWELVFDTNYWGVVHGLRAALVEMVPAGEGWVVAVASGAGLVATPGLAPYVSSKHAVVGVMESVHHELARVDSDVGVSVVCPGNVSTGLPERPDAVVGDPQDAALADLHRTVQEGVRAGADPATVVAAVLEAVRDGRFWVLPQPEVGWVAHDRTRRLSEGEAPVDLLG
jgi:NAD(P)-dependent dehydrogenase (short-subunit alcohol dehydrogenase family)